MLEFLDARREPALDGREPISRRSNRLIDAGAGLTEAVDHGGQFVAQPVAGAGEGVDRALSAAGYGFAERDAGSFHLLGQSLEQRLDRLRRPVSDLGGDV